jgi:glycogen operon protein
LDAPRKRLMDFTSKLIELRLSHPNLHRRKFFQDRVIRGSVVKDIAWYNTNGEEFSEADWNAGWTKSLGLMFNGKTLNYTDEEGKPILDDSFLILINASPDGVEFSLPKPPDGNPWGVILRTENIEDPFGKIKLEDKIIVGGRSLVLLSDREPAEAK